MVYESSRSSFRTLFYRRFVLDGVWIIEGRISNVIQPPLRVGWCLRRPQSRHSSRCYLVSAVIGQLPTTGKVLSLWYLASECKQMQCI
jgi:hypothetical protein